MSEIRQSEYSHENEKDKWHKVTYEESLLVSMTSGITTES